MIIQDVMIIGAGPAGIAAAIQLKRSGVEPILLEKESVGGLLKNANWVENYPGFPKGISGPDLVKRFQDHLKQADVSVQHEKVLTLSFDKNLFHIRTDKNSFQSRYIVLASGTVPEKDACFSIPKELEERIVYEVNPIRHLKNETIAIIGGGDAALDFALTLAEGNNQINILNRSSNWKCLPLLKKKCLSKKNISLYTDLSVQSILKESDGIVLNTLESPSQKNQKRMIDYCIIAIGRKLCLDYLDSPLKIRLEKLRKKQRLFSIGDLNHGRYRQTAICTGEGVKTAMQLAEIIKETN